jgi:hypothetical protein
MYSYKHFTPGKKSIGTNKLINYNAALASKKIVSGVVCNCFAEEYKKFTSQTTISNTSKAQRIAQTINNTIGGSVQFGSYYLGAPVIVNYLGRTEGQPGGSGGPLRNRF